MAINRQQAMIKASLIALALMVSSTPALACSCARPDPALAQEYLHNAKAVFIGQMIGKTALPGAAGRIQNKFDVVDSWKGAYSQTITVETQMSDGPCGNVEFETGKQYLIFTDRQSFKISTMCGPTRVMDSQADKDAAQPFIERLGPAQNRPERKG